MKCPFPKALQPGYGAADTARRLRHILDPELSIPDRIRDIVRREIDEYWVDTEQKLALLDAFRTAYEIPRPITVTLAGGARQTCWTVTRSGGCCRVIYLPLAGVFALCREGSRGIVDSGIHGSALGCFGAV